VEPVEPAPPETIMLSSGSWLVFVASFESKVTLTDAAGISPRPLFVFALVNQYFTIGVTSTMM
jgi:hypothetical protein